MAIDRRRFLQAAGGMAGLTLLPFGPGAFAASLGPAGALTQKRLVVLFLRGAVDGLNVVAPYGERAYYDYRPTIALARPGDDGGLIDLDGHFGLHPALAPLLPLWREKNLAFVHAAGSPDPTRSHFDAQFYMESGTPGVKTTPDGWMNRLLAALPGPHAPTEGVSFGATMPRIFTGAAEVASLPQGKAGVRHEATDRPRVGAAFARLYDGPDAMSRAYREGQAARERLMTDLAADMKAADDGAPPPDAFVADSMRLARLFQQDGAMRLAFLSYGGVDTHVRQGAATGQLASRLHPLSLGLAHLATTLGPAWRDTLVLVISEFGRTARENGDGGTDHGHGNAIWILGGNVNGGRVYGDWPGLEEASLYQNRDLAVTTDFRSVIASLLERHLRLPDATLARIFPAAPAGRPALARILRA